MLTGQTTKTMFTEQRTNLLFTQETLNGMNLNHSESSSFQLNPFSNEPQRMERSIVFQLRFSKLLAAPLSLLLAAYLALQAESEDSPKDFNVLVW